MSVDARVIPAVAPSAELARELLDVVDDRTLEILERRRKTAVVRRRGWLVRRALAAADVAGLLLAFFVAELLTAKREAGIVDVPTELVLFSLTLPAWVLAAKIYGLYDRDEERADHSTVDELVGVFHLITVGTWVFFAGAWITSLADPYLPKLIAFWILATVIVAAARASARALSRRNVNYIQNAIIVGAGDVGQELARKLLRHPEYGINLVGFVDDEPRERADDLGYLTILGGPDNLPALVRLLDVERVVVAFSSLPDKQTLSLIRSLQGEDVQIDVVPRLFDAAGPRVGFHTVEGFPLVSFPALRLSRSSLLIKRAMDIVLSAVGLVFLAPLLAAIALAIRLESKGPMLYRHRRVGRNGQPIDVLKFRTMYLRFCRGKEYGGDEAEREFSRLMADSARRFEFETNYKLRDDPRVTRVGALLRRTSLDEFPQLWNVLRGSLSLVGPRAIVEDELSRYGEGVVHLLNIRPGVTGYWQINGRSNLSYAERVRLDLAYVTNWSLGLDLTILAKTGRALLSRQGAC